MVGLVSLHHSIRTGSGVHTASYPMGTGECIPDIKRPGREADYSAPSIAEFKNAYKYTSAPPILLHGVLLS